MPTEKKAATIAELAELLGRAELAILTDYRGLNTSALRELRLQLRPSGTEYHIAKNTLLRFAAERVGKDALKPALEGPTAVAFVFGDLQEPVRRINDYIRTNRSVLKIKCGLLGTQMMSAA